jgi:hypothetical protein
MVAVIPYIWSPPNLYPLKSSLPLDLIKYSRASSGVSWVHKSFEDHLCFRHQISDEDQFPHDEDRDSPPYVGLVTIQPPYEAANPKIAS